MKWFHQKGKPQKLFSDWLAINKNPVMFIWSDNLYWTCKKEKNLLNVLSFFNLACFFSDMERTLGYLLWLAFYSGWNVTTSYSSVSVFVLEFCFQPSDYVEKAQKIIWLRIYDLNDASRDHYNNIYNNCVLQYL